MLKIAIVNQKRVEHVLYQVARLTKNKVLIYFSKKTTILVTMGVKGIESQRKRVIMFFDFLKKLKIQKVKKRLSIIPLPIYNFNLLFELIVFSL